MHASIKPQDLSATDVDRMVRSVAFSHVADWLMSYVVKQHPDRETLRQKWMTAEDRWAARAGWSLSAQRVVKSPDGLDLPALLDRIDAEMTSADPVVQWTRIACLRRSASTFPHSAREPSPLENDWESIATIPYRRAARRPSRPSGSTRW